jgi:hypothetical protein
MLRLSLFLAALLFPSAMLCGASKDDVKLRVVCVSALPADTKVVLASRDKKGKWREDAEVELRASSISSWLDAEGGAMQFARREGQDLKPLCEFQFPAGSKRAVVALIADAEAGTYKAVVFDPAAAGFDKGTVMVINASAQSASVALGSNEKTMDAGTEAVVKPALDGDGNYRSQVSSVSKDGAKVLCHDRQIQGDPQARELMFLLSDKILGIKVSTLPIFGSLE